jgi:Domain of unknown function (DUF4184)
MPFTLSHAAAVIPIRRYGILSALVVGSFVPDILYFIPRMGSHLKTGSDGYAHSLPGLFFFCLPVGLAVLCLFHICLKRPLISLFPAAHQQKLLPAAEGFSFFPVSQFVKIMVSILLGAASHITWDSFTHRDGWMVEQVNFLQMHIAITPHLQIGVYDLLQYGGSAVGLLLLAYYYFRWVRETPSLESAHAHYSLSPLTRMLMLLIFAAGAVAPAAARLWLNPLPFHFGRTFLGYSAILGLKILTLEIIIFSLAWHFRRFWQDSQSTPVSD